MGKVYQSDADREQRLNDILLKYVEAEEAGHSPDRRLLLALYPDLASELSEFFEGRDQVEDMSAPIRDFSRSGIVRAALRITKDPAPATGLGNATSASGGPAGPTSELGQLGDYQLISEIGRGGMGIVYEAHQISLNRRVALKVLPFAAALDPKQLQRFKNEATAAASLHHNYIVPVYSVGHERGVHYYAMQYIEGQSLAAMIRELRQQARPGQNPLADKPANDLPSTGPYGLEGSAPAPTPGATEAPTQAVTAMSTERSAHTARFYRRVAELGIRAAEALEHAHQEGVVHRDIKPANLLVDVRGNLWITDFGLALFHSDAGLTMTGELLGTLRYMSPEQAMGKRMLVDHRTDIYSLGVTLYELLTLTPVFDGQDRQELLNQIANEEPRPPRSLDKSIPVELETIILKAIAKLPIERYGSVQEMGDDLRCFLEDKPIKARRPTLREKTVKWSRRHRPVVVSAALLFFLAFVGSVTLTLVIANEHRQTVKALKEKSEALKGEKEKKILADERSRQARDVVDFITRISEDWVGEKGDPQRGRRKILEAALKYYQSFIEQNGDDPTFQAETAASYAKVANILSDLGANLDALGASEKARRMYEKLISEHPKQLEFQDALAATRQHALFIQGGAQLFWLTDPKVQEDLKLSENQIDRITTLNKQVQEQREAFRGFGKPRPDENSQKSEEHRQLLRRQARANAEAIAAILDPAQQKRLKQIGWQTGGTMVFFDPEVIVALELTTDQIDLFHEIQGQAWRATWDNWRMNRERRAESDSDANRKKVDEIWRTAQDQILKSLTPAQEALWVDMVGAPFKSQMRFFQPPPPRPRGHRSAEWPGRESKGKAPPQSNKP
jgi:serine/threonine protein kinase